MFPRASYKMVNKQMRGERDSLICLEKDYLGAANPGERKILTRLCPQGVPRVSDGATPSGHSLESKRKMFPNVSSTIEVQGTSLSSHHDKSNTSPCKIFREFQEVEKSKTHPFILIPKKTPLTFSSIVLFYIFYFI